MRAAIESRISIRFAEPDDAVAIAGLMHASFVEYQSLYTGAGFRATAISDEKVVERMKEGPVWVAFLDQALAGTASAVAKSKSLYIRGMAVSPSARGHRIGELLLGRIEEFASERQFEQLFLSTTPFLDRAIRLYQRFGFQRTDEEPGDLYGTPLFTMEKKLSLS